MAERKRVRRRRRPAPGKAEAPQRAEANLTAAQDAFAAFRDQLNELLHEVRSGETARARMLGPIIGELAKAVGRIADEEGKLDGQHDGSGSGAFDLAAARAEICRRLAELRAAD